MPMKSSTMGCDENTIGITYEGSAADLAFESIPLDGLLKK
jgi:hypothetical protein